jgi:hypothetical protein
LKHQHQQPQLPTSPPRPLEPRTSNAPAPIGIKPAEFSPDVKLFQGSTVHPNTAQDWLFVSEDKVRLYLRDYADAVNKRSGWIAPLTFTVTVAGTIATVSFVEKFGKSSAFWEALFYIALVFGISWTVAALVDVFRY